VKLHEEINFQMTLERIDNLENCADQFQTNKKILLLNSAKSHRPHVENS